jgi:hypothetical protein
LRANSQDSAKPLDPALERRASTFISNIFEGIFQNVYSDAYDNLSPEDKVAVLNAAAPDLKSRFNHDWILEEMIRLGHQSSAVVFGRFCSAAPRRQGPIVGESEKLFAASIVGLAKLDASLPTWTDESASPWIAWRIMREVFYQHLIGKDLYADAFWQQLESEDPLGGVSVFLQFRFFLQQLFWNKRVSFLPEETSPARVKRLLEIGLNNWERLDFGALALGGLSHDFFGMACQILLGIGDQGTVELLHRFTGDPGKGENAIRTIRMIKQRLRNCRAS